MAVTTILKCGLFLFNYFHGNRRIPDDTEGINFNTFAKGVSWGELYIFPTENPTFKKKDLFWYVKKIYIVFEEIRIVNNRHLSTIDRRQT